LLKQNFFIFCKRGKKKQKEMQIEQYRSLPLKPLNTTAVIELQVFFDQLFEQLSTYSPTTPNEILDRDEKIIIWKQNVAAAKFEANYAYTTALDFYKANYKDYEDIHRTTSHRLLRSAINTLSFLGNSPARMIASAFTTGGIGTTIVYYASSQKAIQQGAAEIEQKTIEKEIESGSKKTESSQRQIELATEELNARKKDLETKNTTLINSINEKEALERKNDYNQYNERIGLLETTITKQQALYTIASTAVYNIKDKIENLIQKQVGIEQASHKLAGAKEMAQKATESLTNSSVMETLTNMLPTIALGGFVVTSILGLSAIVSRHNRKQQLKMLKLNISGYVNTFHINMLTSDYNRKLIDDKFNLDQKSFENLVDFQKNLQESLRITKELQMHHLIDQCRSYRNRHHKVDFLRFYYYLRRFMTSTFSWTETECDTTHSLFFDEVFDKLNAKRASKKYNDSNGVYDGEFEPFVPLLENQEPYIPLVLHMKPKAKEKEANLKFATIENLEEQAKIAKKNGTDVEFWTKYIQNKDAFVLEYLGNKIWGEDKWIYLQSSQDINATKNSFDNEEIYSLMSRLDDNNQLMAKHIWEGFSSSISGLLLPLNYHKLRTDRSLFYNQCRIDSDLQFIAQKYIKLIMLNYIQYFNIEHNEFFNRETYEIKFEELINNFLRECGVRPPSVIVFALRALTPTVVENFVVDAILYKRNESTQLEFIAFGNTILELYDGKPSLQSDGSNSFTSELPTAEFPKLKRKDFEETKEEQLETKEEQPLKKTKRGTILADEDIQEPVRPSKGVKRVSRQIEVGTILADPRRKTKLGYLK
jgi:mRNA-degrading endonuclease YafQ of YafQ-DinJ toxin-antitoxin module